MSEKLKTFAFTHRPRGGITDNDITKLVKYVKKHAEFYYVITEKEDDERHIHACWITKKETTRSNISTILTRLYRGLDPDEKKVMLHGLKVWRSTEFLNYMRKGDSTVVIEEYLPETGTIESYFPVTKVQSRNKQLQYHTLMERLETLWKEHVPTFWTVNTENVRHFLFDMQYNKRLIGLMDDKKLIQVSKWLTRWMLKANHCTIDMPVYEKEEGEDIYPLIRY